MALGREIAPHVRTASEKYLPDAVTAKKEDNYSKLDDVMEVVGGGLSGEFYTDFV